MENGAVLIEKLLDYAKENLELNDCDVGVKRDILQTLFGLKAYKTEEVAKESSFRKLLENLTEYVRERKLAPISGEKKFIGLIFSVLLPLPSHIDKKFRALREKFGANAACEYLYGLSSSSGQISGKALKDVAYRYYEGEGVNVFVYEDSIKALDIDDLRNVSLDLNGKKRKMAYVEPTVYDRQCALTADKVDGNFADVVLSMLDFIEYLPDYSASAFFKGNKYGSDNFGKVFTAGISNNDFAKKADFTASSENYPDVEISVYDGEFSAVSMQSFNRNTLERLAVDLLEKWLIYSDDEVFGKGADGVSRNDVFVSVKYSQDNRYKVDISLYCDKKIDLDEDLSVFEKVIVSDYSGTYYLSGKAKEQTEMACAVLTKKIPMDDSLFADGGALYGLKDFITDIIKEEGFYKDSSKAENAFKQAFVKKLIQVSSVKTPFSGGDDEIRSFKSFLSTSNVK